MILNPSQIESRSMEIIESELATPVPDEIRPIVLRVIHATADFSFAETLRFTPGIVARIHAAMLEGASLVTDTQMALAGINKSAAARLNLRLSCTMSDEDIAAEARTRGCTRAAVGVERALRQPGSVIYVCGNAPTALIRMLELLDGAHADRLNVIGVPVGFVNVVEAKQQLWESGIPCITALGRRGGSTVAAAIVNALMYMIEGVRQ